MRVQVRRGTTAQWTAADAAVPPRLLAQGEFGLDTDTDTLKIGDGVTDFASLPEIGSVFDGTLTGVGLTLATVGETITIEGGADAVAGTGVLSAGAASVATTALTDNSLIFLTHQNEGTGTPGVLCVNGKVSGAGFDVSSTEATDDSTFAWWFVELA